MIGADEPVQFYEVERLIGLQNPAQFGVSINYHSAFVNANRPQPEGDVVQRSAKLSIGAELHNVSKRRLGALLNRSVSVRANDWSGLWRRPRVGRPRDGELEQRSAGIIKVAQILFGKNRREKAFVGVRYEKSCADKPVKRIAHRGRTDSVDCGDLIHVDSRAGGESASKHAVHQRPVHAFRYGDSPRHMLCNLPPARSVAAKFDNSGNFQMRDSALAERALRAQFLCVLS